MRFYEKSYSDWTRVTELTLKEISSILTEITSLHIKSILLQIGLRVAGYRYKYII